jgi:hypothetical protein
MEDAELSNLRGVRSHGFRRPFHRLQVMSWFLLGFCFAVYVIFVPVLLDPKISLGMNILYFVTAGTYIFFWLVASLIDPTDSIVIEARQRNSDIPIFK